jgi:hypothetical protein
MKRFFLTLSLMAAVIAYFVMRKKRHEERHPIQSFFDFMKK